MKLHKVKQKAAVALIASMLVTNVAPLSVRAEGVEAEHQNDDILDEDEGFYDLEDEEEAQIARWASYSNASTASYSNASTASYSNASGSNAIAASGLNASTASYSNAFAASPSDATPSNANDALKLYKNDDGPTIGVTVKGVVQDADGRYYKDSNGNGKLDYYENWNNDPEDRAADLAEQMSVEQLAGMMMICTQFTGQVDEYAASMIASMLPQPDIKLPGKIGELVSKIIASIIRPHSKIDESGYLVERLDPILSLIMKETMGLEADGNTIKNIEDLHLRHFLLRENPTPEYMASWINQLNMVAEGTEFAIPVVVASNSRNENADSGLGTNEASGVFSTWPGTLGLAAAVRGDGGNISLIDEFASIARSEWDACGLKKGYMYMADTMTDPRWQRTYGTFGEDPELNADIIYHLVTGFQGDGGLEEDGVALTVKHFPGGGARENGFDPHYKLGKWNVYATEGSLETYHLPAFQAAIDAGVSSIMPYYAIPSAEKSASQTYEGENVPMRPVGFAFNEWFLAELLREQMGFEGYVNSDSGVTRNRDHGVEDLDDPEKTALAINAGTDIIGDIGIVQDIIDAYDRSQNNYYDTHDAPSGFTEDELILTRERMVEANTRLLTEMFELGLFENPYRNAEEAEEIVSNPDNWDAAYEAHQKSVVLLKNTEQVLPLTDEKLDGKKVYVQYFGKSDSDATTENLRDSLEGCGFKMTDDYEDADYALLFVNPSSGSTFTATDGLLELDICTDKTVHKVDQETGLLTDETFEESTIENAGQIKQIADTVHKNGGKVISNVNFTLAWLLGNVEPYSDALLAGFDTFTDATMDAILGEYTPTGRMPITLPKDDSVIAVDEEGHCISPNDIPGFAKDEYMPDNMKDENGKAYAYRDSDGNYYELNFGLMNYGENTGEPDEPDKPGDSDKPDQPDQPDKPGNPDKPDQPDQPDKPGDSDKPDQPDQPDKPGDSDKPGSGSSSGGGSSHGGGGGRGSSSSSNPEAGSWVHNENGWWFKFNNGDWPHARWMQQNWAGKNTWYYFNDAGYMVTGWIDDQDGNRYYLHPLSDGDQGAMYTGWHLINGVWYYFSENSDGTMGHLLRNTVTPDGYQVGADGAWIQ